MQSMGPKIASFEKKSRGISRTATMKGGGEYDDADNLDPVVIADLFRRENVPGEHIR